MYYLHPERRALRLADKPFASGGEGELYAIKDPDYAHCVAKLFFERKRDERRRAKIEFLVANPPEGIAAFGESERDNDLVWPLAPVVDAQGRFAGYIMPAARGELLEVLCAPKLPKHLGREWKRLAFEHPDALRLRAKVCYNLAAAVHRVHRTGRYVFVDLKPDNVLLQSNGWISIVDMDSIEVLDQGQTLFAASAATPDYTPPEYYAGLRPGERVIDETWDRFSLSVIFYRVLFGIHPFAATALPPYDALASLGDKIAQGLFVHAPSRSQHFAVVPLPHKRFWDLDANLQALFLQALEQGHGQPTLRPEARNWAQGFLDSPLLLIDRQVPSRSLQIVVPKSQNWYQTAFERATTKLLTRLPAAQNNERPNAVLSLYRQDSVWDLAAPLYQRAWSFLGTALRFAGIALLILTVLGFGAAFFMDTKELIRLPLDLLRYSLLGIFYFTFRIPLLPLLAALPLGLALVRKKTGLLPQGASILPPPGLSRKKRLDYLEKKQNRLFTARGKAKYRLRELQTEQQVLLRYRNDLESRFARQHQDLIRREQQAIEQRLQRYTEQLEANDRDARLLFEEEARAVRELRQRLEQRLAAEPPFSELPGKDVAEKLQCLSAWRDKLRGTLLESEHKAKEAQRQLERAQAALDQELRNLRQHYDGLHQRLNEQARYLQAQLRTLHERAVDDFQERSQLQRLLSSPEYLKAVQAEQTLQAEISEQEAYIQDIQKQLTLVRDELKRLRP